MNARSSIGLGAVALLLLVVVVVSGCGAATQVDVSQDVPPGVNPDPEKGPGIFVVPPEPDLSTPESAVASYLDWVTLAYRMANSDVATHTFTPFEEVRVDSYIELNRQENQGIDQTLTTFEIREASTREPTATVSAYEEWRYRYFTLDMIEWIGQENEIAYETTYTVLLQPAGYWLVDSVEATPLSGVP